MVDDLIGLNIYMGGYFCDGLGDPGEELEAKAAKRVTRSRV